MALQSVATSGPRLSARGRVAASGFDGPVTVATLGVDGHWEHWLTGVALAYSEGDGSFTQVELPGGAVDSTLTSVHPYVAYALSDRVRLWGMAGYGSGSLQLRLAEQHAMDTDLAMTMGALGVRGSLLEPPPEGGLAAATAGRLDAGTGLRPGCPAGPGPADAIRPGGAGGERQPSLARGGASGHLLVAELQCGGQPPPAGRRRGGAGLVGLPPRPPTP